MEGFNGIKHSFLIIIYILGFYIYLTDLSKY